MKATFGLLIFAIVTVISYIMITRITEWNEAIILLTSVFIGLTMEIIYYTWKRMQ